jgi:hypothetical protein
MSSKPQTQVNGKPQIAIFFFPTYTALLPSLLSLLATQLSRLVVVSSWPNWISKGPMAATTTSKLLTNISCTIIHHPQMSMPAPSTRGNKATSVKLMWHSHSGIGKLWRFRLPNSCFFDRHHRPLRPSFLSLETNFHPFTILPSSTPAPPSPIPLALTRFLRGPREKGEGWSRGTGRRDG